MLTYAAQNPIHRALNDRLYPARIEQFEKAYVAERNDRQGLIGALLR